MTTPVNENKLPFISKINDRNYPPLNIIVAVDSQNGIGKNGQIPWKCTEDMQFFRRKTLGKYTQENTENQNPNCVMKYNAVILGRKTLESIPAVNGKILPGRIKVIISPSMLGSCYELPELTPETADSALFIFASFDNAVTWCNKHSNCNVSTNVNINVINTKSTQTDNNIISALNSKAKLLGGEQSSPSQRIQIRKIYACGGAVVYAAANHHPQLHKIYMTWIGADDYDCDVFYRLPPANTLISAGTRKLGANALLSIYKRCNPQELQYLAVMRNVLLHGTLRPNRTGIKTYSLFSQTLEYPLSDSIGNKIMPLLTTKRVFFVTCYKELLWFLAGGTNAKPLQAQNVHIWDGNSSREFLDARGLHHYKTGQLGPVYGAQWRHFGGTYNAQTDTMSGGVDQIGTLINGLKTDPFSRRHVLSAWNPADLDKMALPPCHLMSIFYVELGGKDRPNLLNCKVIIRSNDMFLGHPFNVASYAALTHILAAICGMQANRLIIDITDCHIYENHVDQVNTQLARTPYGFPSFTFNETIEQKIKDNTLSIDDFNTNSILLKNYICYDAIKGEMAK